MRISSESKNRSEKTRISSETTRKVRNHGLLYPKLSYQVVGAIFAVWKELGPAFKESVYQKAIAKQENSPKEIFSIKVKNKSKFFTMVKKSVFILLIL